MRLLFCVLVLIQFFVVSSGSYNYGLFYGVIGSSVEEMKMMHYDSKPAPSNGECMWVGKAPFCSGTCPLDFKQIRKSYGYECKENKKCEEQSLAEQRWTLCGRECTKVDKHFGGTCLFGKKTFCCRQDSADNTWDGIWTSALTGNQMRCIFNATGRCGRVSCTENHVNSLTYIGGYGCDQIRVLNDIGTAEAGLITFEKNGVYYKTGNND